MYMYVHNTYIHDLLWRRFQIFSFHSSHFFIHRFKNLYSIIVIIFGSDIRFLYPKAKIYK